jgi:hypothetical protein
MSRAAVTYPSKDELRAMNVMELTMYIQALQQRLAVYKTGPVHKTLVKHLEVAVKVREIQRGREGESDV